MQLSRKDRLKKRHIRVRKKVAGTAERPRLYVRKSLKHLYAQVVDDSPEAGSKTLAIFTTATKDNNGKHSANVNAAVELGKIVGTELKARGITQVVFDRGGYRYHGVVKAIADSVRETGITI